VKWRIIYKLATLTHKILSTNTPSYLSDLLIPYAPSRLLCSISVNLLTLPRTKLVLSSCAVCVWAPTVWNSLENAFCDSQTCSTFKQHLKHTSSRQPLTSPHSEPLNVSWSLLTMTLISCLLIYLCNSADWLCHISVLYYMLLNGNRKTCSICPGRLFLMFGIWIWFQISDLMFIK